MKLYRTAILDFSDVDKNYSVKAQEQVSCIFITAYGGGAWFSPELGRYPSRQDLAVITETRSIEI